MCNFDFIVLCIWRISLRNQTSFTISMAFRAIILLFYLHTIHTLKLIEMLNEHTNTNKQTTTSLKSMEKMSFVAVQALIDRTTFVMDEPVIKEFCIILSVTTALQTLQCIVATIWIMKPFPWLTTRLLLVWKKWSTRGGSGGRGCCVYISQILAHLWI